MFVTKQKYDFVCIYIQKQDAMVDSYRRIAKVRSTGVTSFKSFIVKVSFEGDLVF